MIPCLGCTSDFDLSRMCCGRSPNSGHHYLAHGQKYYILSIHKSRRRYPKLKTAEYYQRILTAETMLSAPQNTNMSLILVSPGETHKGTKIRKMRICRLLEQWNRSLGQTCSCLGNSVWHYCRSCTCSGALLTESGLDTPGYTSHHGWFHLAPSQCPT